MKDTDYICMLAPMKSKLKLKGNAVILFALIHGYSKDGKTTCRASLQTMAEWIDSDRSAVSKIISKLEESGYINKMPYYVGGVKCFEYTTNYEALLAKYNAENATCLTDASEQGCCQNDNGCQNDNKCCQNDKKVLSKRQRGVVKMTTNNINIIYYNIFSSAEPAQQKREREEFLKIFFFRNAVNPTVEVDKFIAYYDSIEWRSDKGRKYETFESRLALARLWALKEEGQWARPEYVKAVKAIYDEAIQENIEGVEVLIDQRVNLKWNGRTQVWEWEITTAAHQWVQEHFELVKKHIKPILGQKTSVSYKQVA